MTGSYQLMTHDSVFFQLPLYKAPCTMLNAELVGEKFGANILVWTTTPWTLSSNVALAVNPEIDYVKVKLKSQDTPVILAKNAIKQLGDDKLEVLDIFKGSVLVDLNYETCFNDLSPLEFIHRVVAWEDVDAEEGTGVVHIAPGCGAEDFTLGLRENLPRVMPVDDLGIFHAIYGFFSGKRSDSVADEVFAELKKRGKIYKIEPHEHSYPVCWRCKTPVIFRLVPAWYIATEELKPRLLAAAKRVKWEPESGGRRMEDWLTNMGDWNISRKRYYGLPLPFYPCACGELTVIGSKEELGRRSQGAGERIPELHRPWIDEIEITCPKCGKKVKRIPDTGDVWLDAGIVPFSTTGYFVDKDAWARNYPAEWITENSEQVRLWFYSMLFMSVVLEDRPPYERAMCYGTVLDENGGRFSKTGYMIQFDEAAEEIGSDTIRYLYAGNPVTSDVRFGFTLGDEARRKLLGFRNIYTFFDTYYTIDRPDLTGTMPQIASPLDRWLLLRTNQFLGRAAELMDAYKAYVLVKEFEDFVEDVSNWYIRLNRRRFWKSEDAQDQRAAYYSLYASLKAAVQVMAPIIPFQTEAIWQKLIRKAEPDAQISVHLAQWPQPLPDMGDDGLLEDTALVREVIATALRLRNEQQIKVRQPLQTLYLVCDEKAEPALQLFEKQLLDELNVKELIFLPDAGALQIKLPTVNFKLAGAALKNQANPFKAHLAALSPEAAQAVAAQAQAGGPVAVPGWEGAMDAALFLVQAKTRPGIVSTTCRGDEITVALDIEVTQELRQEGAVRDVIRQIQVRRKEMGLAVEQRIKVRIHTDKQDMLNTLNGDRTHIMAEVLANALDLGFSPIEELLHERDEEYQFFPIVEIANQPVVIGIAK